MTIDDLVRRAAADLLEDTERRLDLDATRARLDVARRRRRVAISGAAAAAVAVALLVGSLLASGGRGAPVPAPDVRHTTTVSLSPHGEELLDGTFITDTFATAKPGGCLGVAVDFSPDGNTLAIACSPSGATYVVTERDLEPRRVAPGASGVTWTRDGSSLVLARDSTLEVVHLAGAFSTSSVVTLPEGWTASSVDAGPGDRLVIGGRRGTSFAIMTLDIDGSRPELVLTTGPDSLVIDPRWSPNGDRIGFVQRDIPPSDPTRSPMRVRTVLPDGTGARTVIARGRGLFGGGMPGFDWSPTGRMAFVTVEGAEGFVVLLRPDGSIERTRPGIGPVAWRPAG